MDNQTPGEILSKFYADNYLAADGGQSSSSVKIVLAGNFIIYYPNFNARRKAVLKHDIHHILTEYNTDLSGESEICAWEIASGCKGYWAAFFIDTSGIMIGFLFNYWGVLKAFARGRKTKNLYHDMFTDEKVVDFTVSELRSKLNLDKFSKNTKPAFTDFILLNLFAVYGAIYSIILLVLLPYFIFYSIYISLKTKKVSQ